MVRDEMLIRHGFYCGYADRRLGTQYGAQWLGRASELTEAQYLSTVAEIQGKLRDAGLIGPDEDPFETEMNAR